MFRRFLSYFFMKYFAYCRKSQDAEERQILSIPAQRDEVARLLQKHPDIEIIRTFEEARTAKAPGRPVFDDMMRRLQKGEAEGIIAWHPDRLARNSIDGGLLIYLLDRGVLKDLKFSAYTFENSSQGKFMLQIMFGYSKYYVDSLSENVKRGNRRKLEQGILPNKAPIGYRNDPQTKTIVPDPRSFSRIRDIWDLMLGGAHNPRKIRDITEFEWGFRTPMHRRSGGKPLAYSTIYKLLTNRFYAGIIDWGGKSYHGAHEAMITLKEFDEVQVILGRPGRTKSKKHRFPYTGLIRCGTCGCAITAETKINRYGYRYEYYHCTKKRRDMRCPEPCLERHNLDRQILAFLKSLQISQEVFDWAVAESTKMATQRDAEDHSHVDNLKTALAGSHRELQTLTDLRVRNLLEDAEFVARRRKIQDQIFRLERHIQSGEQNAGNWLEPLQALFSFSKLAVSWFEAGSLEQKRLILSCTGSNLTLSNKILSIQAAEPLELIPKSEDFPALLAVVDNVRKKSTDMSPQCPWMWMQQLLEELGDEDAYKQSATSPTSLSPRRAGIADMGAFNKPMSKEQKPSAAQE